ncbi:hypothetical protein AXK57_16925 [Tsukamurella pulmonis]|nr:hypothetical protein [Tsukamurella pulmonis]KXO92829.1 hypothetical protein AXK56_22185 [Tsukamurella pulmonis]KXP08155.1 hypothetical protein AXK57_16925 [Tsukamurella pulmonis]
MRAADPFQRAVLPHPHRLGRDPQQARRVLDGPPLDQAQAQNAVQLGRKYRPHPRIDRMHPMPHEDSR